VTLAERATLLVAAPAIIASAACQFSEATPGIRLMTDDLAIRVSSEPVPPRARERTVYKVVVRDKESGEPVENGEGRIFATSRDGANTWDILTAGPQIGTYYGTLKYVAAGDWAVAIQFRRDSTRPLERIDWMQEVRAGAPAY
jgi:hypothetical protein